MGYYTTFEGEISYKSDFAKEKIVEHLYDIINNASFGASGYYGQGRSIEYYNSENRWIHFFGAEIDRENKIIDFSGERKDYEDSTATFLMFIAPYLDTELEFTVEFKGEDGFYYEEDGMGDSPYHQITVKNGNVYINGEPFVTENKMSIPLPVIS